MKDNLSLIAASVGGFMLSVAAAGIVKAAPVTSLTPLPSLNSTPVVNLQTPLRLCGLKKVEDHNVWVMPIF
jgi:hypothetical protein